MQLHPKFALLSVLLGAASVVANATSNANASSNSSHTQDELSGGWLEMLHVDKFIFSFLVFLPPGLRIADVGDWFVKTVINMVKGMGQEQADKAVRALQAPLLDASRAAVQGGGIAWRLDQHLFIRSGEYSQADKPQNDPKGSKWEWKDDEDGWVAYLSKGIDGWLMARQASGWGHRTAVLVAIGKLLFWHLLQPAMYCVALYLYWDTIDTSTKTLGIFTQRNLAQMVLIREGLYMIECIVGLWIAPYYLLVHPGKSHHGTESSSSRMLCAVTYALMPERFVFSVILQACMHDSTPTPTVSLTTETANLWKVLEVLGLMIFFICDQSGIVALQVAITYNLTPFPLMVGYAITSVAFVASMWRMALVSQTQTRRALSRAKRWFYRVILVLYNVLILTLCYYNMFVLGACDIQGDWTTACWTTILLPFIAITIALGLYKTRRCVPCLNTVGRVVCMVVYMVVYMVVAMRQTVGRVVCMVLQDEDVEDTDEVERRRCSQNIDAMLQKHKILAASTAPMSEVELWTLLESVNSVAKSSTGAMKTAAETRRQKLAASLRARLLCAEVQAQLVGAGGARAREIVKDLDNKLKLQDDGDYI